MMSLDHITREQFELYKTVERKEKELQYARQGKGDGVLTFSFGSTFLTVGVYNVFQALGEDNIREALGYGGFAALGALILGYGLTKVSNDHKARKSLEREIASLKSDPRYRALIE